MKICTSERTHGKTLPENGYQWKKVRIYRALKSEINEIKRMDYVTLSEKWAKEHAQHMAATEGKNYSVLSVIVNSSDVAEAYNPGEYFYIGEDIVGNVVYTVSSEELI